MDVMARKLLGSESEAEKRSCIPFEFSAKASPWTFVASQRDAKGDPLFKLRRGTTTLGFVFGEGAIIAVDSRASMGSFVSSEGVRKIIEINDRFLGTMAGGAADCQYWQEYLRYQIALYELNLQEPISVRGASRLFSEILAQYRGYGLSVGSMVVGSDATGVHLYYCDDDGKRLKGDRFAIGSGGTYAYGVLDSHYRFDMSLEEGVALAKRAISEATFMDSGSGGLVRVCHVFPGGWRYITEGEDCSELIWAHRRLRNAL